MAQNIFNFDAYRKDLIKSVFTFSVTCSKKKRSNYPVRTKKAEQIIETLRIESNLSNSLFLIKCYIIWIWEMAKALTPQKVRIVATGDQRQRQKHLKTSIRNHYAMNSGNTPKKHHNRCGSSGMGLETEKQI